MHAFAIMLAIGVQFGLGCMILYLSHLEQIQWAARSPLNFLQGHRVARSDVKNPDVFEKYQCPHCKLLLKDAVQPLCGHWLCECCANELLESIYPKCPRADCQEDLKADPDEGAEYFPDRFVRREIEGLIVSCSNRPEGCQWEDRLVKLDDHRNLCSFAILGCQCCGKTLPVDQMESHKLACPKSLMKCPLAEFGCQHTQQITREELRKHVATHSLEHLEMLVDAIQLLKKQTMHPIKPIIPQADDDSNATGQDFGRMSDGIERDCAVPKVVKSKEFRAVLPNVRRTTTDGLERDYAGEKKAYQAVFADGPGVTTDGSTYGGLPDRNALEVHAATTFRNSSATTLKNPTSVLEAKFNADLKRKDEEITTLRNNMTKLEKAMRSKHAEFEDRDFRLSLIENSNHDGNMIWKIPQFSQRMADAQSGRYTSIFSLPFYTGRYGYKMCLRLYILGDGIGKNTHMSLFFVIMKGEFDNILQWPFTSKVTFKLINQTGNRDIIDTFQPDPMSSSFQKPKSDMNIASGCPRFVSHTELKNSGFIVDDTVFVKCSIDCATVKHP